MNDMRDKTVCFTGHRRVIHKGLEDRLDEVISILAEDGFKYFGVGGAIGFDLLAAKSVLKMKEKYPEIKLVIVLPCKDYYAHKYSVYAQEYKDIFKRADKVKVLNDTYFTGCMQMRNKHLVDNSSVCVCYRYISTGGTAYTVKCAEKQGLTIIDII